MNVELVEITPENWRAVVDLEPRPEQRRFVAPISRYLCLAHFEGEWQPHGIVCDGEMVGHVMWAYDATERAHWIGGLVVDARRQGEGIGRRAMELAMARLVAEARAERFALSYEPDNHRARSLYRSLGFVETGEMEGDEMVARRE